MASSLSSPVWGHLAFRLVHTIHRLFTREQDSRGLGNCRLMAAIGAWFGVELLIQTIATAPISSLLFPIAKRGPGEMTVPCAWRLVPGWLREDFALFAGAMPFRSCRR